MPKYFEKIIQKMDVGCKNLHKNQHAYKGLILQMGETDLDYKYNEIVIKQYIINQHLMESTSFYRAIKLHQFSDNKLPS